MSVEGYECIEIDEVGQTLRCTVGDPCSHHAAITVPDQEDVLQVFKLEDAEHIRDVGLKPDFRTGEMNALTDAGISGGEQFMTSVLH